MFVFPASVEQHRYWVLDQLDRGSTASNMALHFRLSGRVDARLLEQTLNVLVARHEALRTTFDLVDGELCQIIQSELTLPLAVSDLRSLPEGEREQEAHQLILEHARVHLDVAHGPLMASRLITVSDTDHFLACTLHHIVCDGWSNGILVREVVQVYDALAEGREPDVPELPFQFADFAMWQHEWLKSDAAAKAYEFWRTRIRPETEVLDLTTDRPRRPGKSFPGHIESKLIPPPLAAALRQLCQKEGATLHILLLAAFQALLNRYTGQTEFLLGSTIANRTQPGMDDVFGRFANPQVIVADVHGNPTFRELLGRVREWSLGTYAHQDMPFARIMEELQLDRAGHSTQFLQTYFVYQKAFMQPQKGTHLSATPIPSVSGGVNFDMLVGVVERAEGPRVQVEYNTVLFDKSRIRVLIEHYFRILETIAVHPDLRVSELDLTTEVEQTSVAANLTGEELSITAPESVLVPIDRTLTRIGTRPVLTQGGQSWTASEMLSLSRRWAARFKAANLSAGATVALTLPNPAMLAAALLGCWRAGLGAIIVPPSEWESGFPSDLLRNVAALAVDNSAQRPGLPAGLQIIQAATVTEDLKFNEAAPVAGSSAAMAVLESADSRAPLTFIQHSSLSQLIAGLCQQLQLDESHAAVHIEGERWADFLAPLLVSLSSGSHLHLVGAETATNGTLAHQIQRKAGAGVVLASNRAWREMVASGWRGNPSLQVVCIGDLLPAPQALDLVARAETVWKWTFGQTLPLPLSSARLSYSDRGESPLGAIPGTSLVVRDSSGRPAVLGSIGEVFCSLPGGALLPLNLIGSIRADGRCLFHERTSRLIRMNGQRVRPSVIEAALLDDVRLEDAAVLVREAAGSLPRLVAYVQPRSGVDLSAWNAAEVLSDRLPKHLVPAASTAVESLTRNAAGQAQPQAFPEPGQSPTQVAIKEEYVEPRNEIEAKLVDIWEKVLDIRGVGVKTNFFNLGGYSLMIVRLFARINKEFNRSLPITTIFNAPTIEKLAAILRGQESYSALVPVREHGSKPGFFLVHSYLLYGGLPTVMGDDQPFFGLRELDTEQGRALSIEERVAGYVEEILRQQPQGPYHIAGWCAAGPLALETARQLAEAGHRVGLVALLDSWRPGFKEVPLEKVVESRWGKFRRSFADKVKFHQKRMADLSLGGKLRYLGMAFMHRLHVWRNKIYLKNWALLHRLSKRYGIRLPDFMHNVSWSTFASVKVHKATPYHGKIVLFRASDSSMVPGSDPACGWNDLALGGVDVRWVPGSHESMFLGENLAVLGSELRELLDHANQGTVPAVKPQPVLGAAIATPMPPSCPTDR